MIEELTPEQVEQLEVYREEWTKIGLSCEPVDLPRALAAVEKIYTEAGLKVPSRENIHVVDSPMAATKLAQELDDAPDSDARKHTRAQIYGSHDAAWLSFYAYFGEVCGLECCKRLEGLMELAKSCGWWSPYEECVILQHRHEELHLDDEGRLHNEEGMAVRYRDGWGVWAINGVRVTEQIVMHPETQTTAEIQSEQNEEIKRIRIERFGWEKYLAAVNAVTIDQRHNDIEATDEALLKADGMTVLLCACPSTARVYTLEVDPECSTCEEAQNYLRSDLCKGWNFIGAT